MKTKKFLKVYPNQLIFLVSLSLIEFYYGIVGAQNSVSLIKLKLEQVGANKCGN